MKRISVILVVILCIVAVCWANKNAAAKEEEDGKVDVVTEPKTEKAKQKKTAKKEELQDEEEHEEQDDEEEEEEEDPNAKIEVEDLYVPKNCNTTTRSGDQVVVHYTGWMSDGSLFDTTIDHRKNYQPFEFILGSGTVIKGFEKALSGMCKQQRRKVIIPPALAYGKKGTTDIPGNEKHLLG